MLDLCKHCIFLPKLNLVSLGIKNISPIISIVLHLSTIVTNTKLHLSTTFIVLNPYEATSAASLPQCESFISIIPTACSGSSPENLYSPGWMSAARDDQTLKSEDCRRKTE